MCVEGAELEVWRRQTNLDPYDLLCAGDLGNLWPHYTPGGRADLARRPDFPKPVFQRDGLNLRLWRRIDLEEYTAARFWLQSAAGKISRLIWIGKNCLRQKKASKVASFAPKTQKSAQETQAAISSLKTRDRRQSPFR